MFPEAVVKLLRLYVEKPTKQPDPGRVYLPYITWNNCCPLGLLPMANDTTPNAEDIAEVYTPVTGVTADEFRMFAEQWDNTVTYENWEEVVNEIWPTEKEK